VEIFEPLSVLLRSDCGASFIVLPAHVVCAFSHSLVSLSHTSRGAIMMRLGKFTVFLLLVSWCFATQSQEFLYPIAVCNNGQVCLIYQKTPTHIELWLWDPITKCATQGLLSRFSPAGLTLLPDGRSFSFINNGALMIKQFIKRSPGTIELSQPLYDLSLPNWLNADYCYLAAKQRSRYGLFQIDRCGEVETICWDDIHDYLYPQKVGDELFCIERTTYRGALQHAIIKISYQKIESNCDQLACSLTRIEEGEYAYGDKNAISQKKRATRSHKVVLTKNVPPASFLNMVSDEVGYYISHPAKVGQKSALVEFTYWRLACEGDQWASVPLFSFELPTDLLLFNRDSRLYESVLPLLPQRFGKKILFVSATEGECGCNLNLYQFDEMVGEIEQITCVCKDGIHYFRPLKFEDGVFYGGSLRDDCDYGVRLWIANDGEVHVQLPFFRLV